MSIETKRGYITKSEVESYCDIAITDDAEAIERMELAEEIIDKYVGFQNAFQRYEITGTATGGSTTTLVDSSGDTLLGGSIDDRYTYCVLHIIGGTNVGEERVITSQDSDTKTVTVQKAFTSAIDSTSVYRIYQLAKFPRSQDAKLIDGVYYKYIPEQVKKATLAQVEYMIEMGDDFFVSGIDKTNENIDGYNYQIPQDVRRAVAPKAREYLKGFTCRVGKLII
jgi:hypothetical protein